MSVKGIRPPLDGSVNWREKGQALEAEGQYEPALEAFRNALFLDPADDVSRFHAAQVLVFHVERPDEAVLLLELRPPGPPDSDLLYLRGRAYADLGKVPEAVRWYGQALQAVRTTPNAVHSAADIHCAMSLDLRADVPRARRHAETAVAANPLLGHAWECLAYFLWLSGEADAALDAIKIAVGLEPDLGDTFRGDPDYGALRDDPRFEPATRSPAFTASTKERLPSLWPPGDGNAARVHFVAQLKRETLID